MRIEEAIRIESEKILEAKKESLFWRWRDSDNNYLVELIRYPDADKRLKEYQSYEAVYYSNNEYKLKIAKQLLSVPEIIQLWKLPVPCVDKSCNKI